MPLEWMKWKRVDILWKSKLAYYLIHFNGFVLKSNLTNICCNIYNYLKPITIWPRVILHIKRLYNLYGLSLQSGECFGFVGNSSERLRVKLVSLGLGRKNVRAVLMESCSTTGVSDSGDVVSSSFSSTFGCSSFICSTFTTGAGSSFDLCFSWNCISGWLDQSFGFKYMLVELNFTHADIRRRKWEANIFYPILFLFRWFPCIRCRFQLNFFSIFGITLKRTFKIHSFYSLRINVNYFIQS